MGPGLSKYQTSDILSSNDGSSSASTLDIRGGNRLYSVLLIDDDLIFTSSSTVNSSKHSEMH